MPIYAYRCAACGHASDVLQKISDPLLTVCPACGAAQYQKQVTAAGFQLKGSGWYATDFRNNGAAKGAENKADENKADGNKPGESGTPATPATADPGPGAGSTTAATAPPAAPAAPAGGGH